MALPDHLQRLFSNLMEVGRLMEIHEELTGTGPGHRHDVQVLNKSAIIFLVACWESYVEDLCEASLNSMVGNAGVHTVFPRSVLERVASKYQGLKAWDLAADGWKVALQNHRKDIFARTTDKLNTPATQQVRDLFNKTIGAENVPDAWHWHGRSATASARTLDRLIKIRGSIAHRVESSAPVHKQHVLTHGRFIRYLAVVTSNHVGAHVHKCTGKRPWSRVRIGKVR